MTRAHKRKLSGLLKYGNRTYTDKKIKLQAGGGFAAYSPGYNWREDPYELMLMKDKMAKENLAMTNSARSGRGKSKSASNAKFPKVGDFPAVTGGLPAANAAANNIYTSQINGFYNAIKTNGPDWLTSSVGQQAYGSIKRMGQQLTEQLKADQDNLSEATKGLTSTDKETYAISSEGNMMVRNKDGVKKISQQEFLKDPTAYAIMTNNKLIDWKKNTDTSNDPGIVNEFLKSGALSPQTIYDSYIKGKDEQIQIAITDGMISLRAKSNAEKGTEGSVSAVMDPKKFNLALTEIQHGIKPTDDEDGVKINQQEVIKSVAADVYNDVMNLNNNNSRFEASLKAEVLRKKDVRDRLAKIETLEGRNQFIIEQMRYTLVSKIVNKGKKSSTGAKADGTSSEGEGAINSGAKSRDDIMDSKAHAKANTITTELGRVFEGGEVSQYSYGTKFGEDEKVIHFNTPQVKNAVGAVALNVNDNIENNKDLSQNSIKTNSYLDSIADTNEVYMEDGTKVSTLLGSEDAANNFINNDLRLSPKSSMDIVFMPIDAKGNMVPHLYKKFAAPKQKVREDFIAAMKLNGTPVQSTADELYKNNLANPGEYDEYTTWIKMGKETPSYEKKYKAAQKSGKGVKEAKKLWMMSKSANKSLQYIMDQRDIIFKGKNITMAPFGKVSTLLDADATEIDEKYTEDAKAKGYAEVALKEITSQEDRDYLQDINDVDNFNWTGDNIYKTNMFIKLKNPKRTGSSKGAEMRDTHIIGLMFEKVVDGVDSSSLVSKKTIENAAAMLLE